MKTLLYVIALSAILVLLRSDFVAQTANVPAAAQDALDKGAIAFGLPIPNYLLAIHYFEDARKLAPDAPEVYYNLGLAESQIPGRELRAICWFGAYLAADPKAPDAAAVKKQIAILEIRSQDNTSRFVKTVQDAAIPMAGNARHETLRSVAELWARAGDVSTALQTADLIQSDFFKDAARSDIAWVQAMSGDIAGAQKTADLIHDADAKCSAQSAIAVAQAKSGNVAGAKAAADLISRPDWKSKALTAIAKVQEKAGGLNSQNSTRQSVSDPQNPASHLYVASDWIRKLDDDTSNSDCPLHAAPFMDLDSYLSSLPSSDDPQAFFYSRSKTIDTIIRAQNVVERMLANQNASTVDMALFSQFRVHRDNTDATPENISGVKRGSLERTSWKGDSPGGEKHYEFNFLPNGEFELKLKVDCWGCGGFVTYPGLWTQTGNTFQAIATYEFQGTITGDTIAGSFSKGKYRFNLVKVPYAAVDPPSRNATGTGPETGTAKCIFYRPNKLSQSSGGFEVSVDSKKKLDLTNSRWVELEVATGHHKLQLDSGIAVIEADFEAGKTYYFKIAVGFSDVHLISATPEEALKAINKLQPLEARHIY